MTADTTYIDELSGVYNRKYLEEEQKQAAVKFIAHQIPFSLVMVDIDHFKEINGMHGHLKGDEVIKEFARFLNEELRKSDTVIRYGGDEFACVMPNTTRQDAESIYRRILKKCKGHKFSGLQISLSVGVASYPRDADDFDGLLKIADQVLYDAKRSGRDRLGMVQKRRIDLPIKVFLDRAEEQEIFRHFLAESREGMDATIIKGKVGIGKTRFTREVLSTSKGREIIWSDCLCLADSIAYYSTRELIKYRIQRLGIETFQNIPAVYRVELGKLVPEIADGITEEHGVSRVQDRYRLYEGIRKVMEVGERPKVIVLDNIQWIDQESVEVIKYLMRALRKRPIIFVFIYRIEEETKFLQDFLLSMSQEIDVKEIVIKPLTRDYVKIGLEVIIGEEPENALLDYVVRESGGVPFYIEETMRGLYDMRHLTVAEDKWVFVEPETEIVPKSLEDITLRKYHSLSKEAQSVLDAASTIGRFDVEILKSLTGYNEGEIIGLINDISRVGLVKYSQDEFIFAEEMSLNTLYKRNVEGIKGMTLHRQIGDKLEEMHTGKEQQVIEELAYHYHRSRVEEKGVHYCMEAGRASMDKYANHSAVQYFTWALELLKGKQAQEQTKKKIDCFHKRASVLNAIGDDNAALSDVEEGLDLALTIGDKEREIALLLVKTQVYEYTSQFRKSIDEAERCRALCIQVGNKARLASALHAIGYGFLMLGDYEKATCYGKEALTTNQELKNKRGEASMLNFMGIIHRMMAKYHQALDYYEKSLELVQEIDYKLGIAACLLNTGIIHRILGEYRKAFDRYEKALQLAQEIGDVHSSTMACSNMGNLYVDLGEFQKALDYLENSLRVRREIGNKTGEAVNQGVMGIVYGRLGQFDRALRFLEDALAIAQHVGDKHTEVFLRDGLGMIYRDIGDYEGAQEQIEKVADMLQEVHDESQVCFNLLHRAEIHLAFHETDAARRDIKKAQEIAESINSHLMTKEVLSVLCELYLEEGDIGSFETAMKRIDDLPDEVRTKPHRAYTTFLLARYYAAKKDFAQAEKHFEKASLMYADLREPLSIGKTYYYRGQMEDASSQDITRSARFYEKAVNIFTSIGARSWQARAEQGLVQ